MQFTEQEISFTSSLDKIKLAGTLTSIKNAKCAVLMIVGSGKTDRDETTPAELTYSGKEEKLFKQISHTLARKGISSFRYDKRGVIDEAGNVEPSIWLTADREHLISDSYDAAKILLSEFKKIIILGHSEGTIIGTELAVLLKEQVQGLMLLGAQARSMKDILYYQMVESELSGPEDIKTKKNNFENTLKQIESSKEDYAPDGKPMNWYRQFLTAPANEERFSLLKVPTVIFQGEEDKQTPVEEISRFKKYRNDFEIYTYPKLGHGFSPPKNGVPTLGPITEEVLRDIADVAQRFSENRSLK